MEHHPGALMEKVKYRLSDPGLAPRRTKLEIPGWAVSGSRAQTVHANRSGTAFPSRKAHNTGSNYSTPTAINSASALKTTSCCWRGIGAPAPDKGVQWPPLRNSDP